MKKIIPYIILVIISCVFFYKLIFFFQIPFPGDVLVSTYSPWKYESFLGYNPGSYPSKAQYFDVVRQMYPWKVFAINEIKEGRFPLWNPHNFSGMPLFANNQSAVINPLNIFFFILPMIPAWAIFIYLQPVIASFGSYLYLRRLKRSVPASLIGSVAFSYSLFMGVFVEYGNFGYSFAYLPLMLFIVEKLYAKSKSSVGILLPILVGITVFSGHFQISGSAIAFAIFYSLVRFFFDKKRNTKSLVVILMYMLMGVLISMVQVLPLLELLGNSARVPLGSMVLRENVLLQFHQLILFFAPDVYGNPATLNYLLKDTYPGNAIYLGILPLFLLFLSFFQIKKEKHIAFFAGALVLLLIFLTNNPVSVFLYSLNLPLISGSSPSNFIYLLIFSIAVLSTFGIDYLGKANFKQKLTSVVIPLLLFLFLIIFHKVFGIEFLTKQLFIGGGILVVSLVCFGATLLIKKEKLLYILLFVLVIDLAYYFLKFNPFVPSALVFPEPKIITEIQKYKDTRVYGYSAASIESNFQTGLGVYSAEGYDPLYPKWYGSLIHSLKDGRLLEVFDETTRSQATIPNGYAEDNFLIDKTRQKLINETASGLILDRLESASKPTTFDPKSFVNIYQKDGWTIYKNIDAKKKVYMTSDYDTYKSRSEFESKFFGSFHSVLLEKNPGIEKQVTTGSKVELILDVPNDMKVKTSNSKDSILVILDTFYPGWKATVDGESVEILRVNYAFRGIKLKKGEHEVALSYRPNSFYFGAILTIMGIVGSIVLFGLIRRTK